MWIISFHRPKAPRKSGTSRSTKTSRLSRATEKSSALAPVHAARQPARPGTLRPAASRTRQRRTTTSTGIEQSPPATKA